MSADLAQALRSARDAASEAMAAALQTCHLSVKTSKAPNNSPMKVTTSVGFLHNDRSTCGDLRGLMHGR